MTDSNSIPRPTGLYSDPETLSGATSDTASISTTSTASVPTRAPSQSPNAARAPRIRTSNRSKLATTPSPNRGPAAPESTPPARRPMPAIPTPLASDAALRASDETDNTLLPLFPPASKIPLAESPALQTPATISNRGRDFQSP